MNHFSENKDLYATVFGELKNIGVKVPKIKYFKSCVQKPDKHTPPLECKMFGISLCKQEWVYDLDYPLPKFLAIATSYLMNFLKTLGLFRKSGSLVRQRNLKSNLEKGEDIEGSDPNDVASLLKQWLRELPEPLIPFYMQDLFTRCQHLVDKQDCTTASLLCCLLLPPVHLHPLKHLMSFLKTFAEHSNENKMGSHNLALMMAPNIFISKAESISKPCSILIQLHTSTIELLIENAEQIGKVPQSLSHKCLLPLSNKCTELVSSEVILDCSPSKITKKIRNDFVCGIRKLVGQNSTSSSTSEKFWDSPKIACGPVLSNNEAEMLCTPHRTEEKLTVRSRTLSNRSRKKSFGLLRRKDRNRKNSNKRSSLTKRNQVVAKVNSNPKSLAKQNSIPKAQDSESGSTVSEFSDSSSPRDSPEKDLCLALCELPSNADTIQPTENDQLHETPPKFKDQVAKLEHCSVKQISPGKIDSYDCQRKLFTSIDTSSVYTSRVDETISNFLDKKLSFSNDIQMLNNGSTDQPTMYSKPSLKIRKSDNEKSGQLKSNSVSCEPVKTVTSDVKNYSKRTFEVGHLDIKTKNKELNVNSKEENSNCKVIKNFNNSRTSSLNRSQSFICNSKWKSESQDTKTPKKTVRSSSLIRGKPNTVKSGLPHQRLHRDSLLTLKTDAMTKCKQSNKSAVKSPTPTSASKSTRAIKNEKYSPKQKTSPLSNLNKSTLKQSKSSVSPISKTSKDIFFTSPTSKDSLNTLSLKSKGRLSLPSQKSSQSSSKIPRLDYSNGDKKKMSLTKKEKSLGSRRQSFENSRIPLLRSASASDSETSMNNSLFFTPNQTLQISSNSTVWVSGSEFLECITPQTDSFNKRESIALILKNNTGQVKAKVNLYNSRDVKSCPTPSSSPTTYQSTPCRRSCSQRQVPSFKNRKPFSVLPRSESSIVKTGEKKISKRLSPSSKSSPYSELVSHRLKEVTNMNLDLSGKQTCHKNIQTGEKSRNRIQKHDLHVGSDNVLNRSILKRNSFAGRTPAKLSKGVSRSESTPTCPRPGTRLFKTTGSRIPEDRVMKVERCSSFSPVVSNQSQCVKKSGSSFSYPKSRQDDMIDEWLCEL